MYLKLCFAVILLLHVVAGKPGKSCKRPGTCPAVKSLGHCAVLCKDDFDCKRRQKCCSNGCGWDCVDVKKKKKSSCTYNDMEYESKSVFMDKCNVCHCTCGKVKCTSNTCPTTMCRTGLQPKPNTFCGGIAGFQCPKPYQCDMTNVPEGSADFPGLCCRGECPNGLAALPYTHCTGRRGCPEGYKCEFFKYGGRKGLCCMDSCNVGGTIYEPGQTFFVECNKCSCHGGRVACTKKGCAEGCYVDGIRYGERDIIPTDDKCDELCKCVLENGNYKIRCKPIVCPKLDCENPVTVKGECCPTCKGSCNVSGTIYQPGDTFFVECNRCSCNDGRVACTKIGCAEGCYVDGIHYGERDIIPTDDKCDELCKCVLENGNYKIRCKPIVCPKPDCENPVTAKGECCPTCKDCSAVRCKAVLCEKGFVSKVPPGECCPQCVPDCSTVRCALIKCESGYKAEVPTGECCPVCVKDCSTVDCKDVVCGKGFVSKVPPGECCPECFPDCSAVLCALIKCGSGYKSEVPKGDCCPTCVKDCSTVKCATVLECKEGFVSEIPPGECCAQCVLDCSAVLCPLTKCKPGFKSEKQSDECCPTCVRDCSTIFCTAVVLECGKGFISKVPTGECCPTCVPDCSTVLCPQILCKPGYTSVIKEGECCSTCVQDCSTVLCALIKCESGYKAEVPTGECCPVCVKGECTHGGQAYSVGDTFPVDCNSCTCMEGGLLTCTKRFCGGCTYNGQTYSVGESYPDECNTCTCTSDGSFACTEKACAEGCYKDGIHYGKDAKVPNDDPCNHCSCVLSEGKYEIKCYMQDCARPNCENPTRIKGKCCPVCPGGCTYNGQTFSVGESYPDECNTCTCTSDGSFACTEMACGGCIDKDGSSYNTGDNVPRDDPCLSCSCTEGGDVLCAAMSCPYCENPTYVKGQCCPDCPKGCTENGVSYNVGDNVPRDDPCLSCSCTEGGEIACMSQSCVYCENPTYVKGQCCPDCPKGCIENGVSYNVGDSLPNRSPCEVGCMCAEGGRVICAIVDCFPHKCQDQIHPDDQCCPECVCRSGDQVYYPGEIVPHDDPCTKCRCNDTGSLECATMACALQYPCFNQMKPPGECCDVCDTSTCKHEGQLIQAGDTVSFGCCECTCYYGETQCKCIDCPPCPKNPKSKAALAIPECCGCR